MIEIMVNGSKEVTWDYSDRASPENMRSLLDELDLFGPAEYDACYQFGLEVIRDKLSNGTVYLTMAELQAAIESFIQGMRYETDGVGHGTVPYKS